MHVEKNMIEYDIKKKIYIISEIYVSDNMDQMT